MSPLDDLEIPYRLNPGHLSRRDFMTLMGATLALAGMSACRNKLPDEALVPYGEFQENQIAGRPLFFATAFPYAGFVQGLLVKTQDGRPIKIEGNPAHPASRGATSLFAQASILDLYSPHRLTSPLFKGSAIGDWTQFQIQFQKSLELRKASKGRGLALLASEVTSPTLRWQISRLAQAFPEMRWYLDNESDDDTSREGIALYDFSKAKRILAIDCDFLGLERNQVANAASYANARRENGGTSRLYVAETGATITGTKADHRWAFSTPDLLAFLEQVELGLITGARSNLKPEVAALCDDLVEQKGKSLVLGGSHLPPSARQRIARINASLGSEAVSGRARPSTNDGTLSDLTRSLQNHEVETLVILRGNPAYTAPSDLDFAQALAEAPLSVYLTETPNETSKIATWALPSAHYLESWSDATADDGTESIIQPLLAPIAGALTAHELLQWMIGEANPSPYETVRAYWRQRVQGENFEAGWTSALAQGLWNQSVIQKERAFGKRTQPKQLEPNPDAEVQTEPLGENDLEIIFRPDPTVWDGTWSENPWLQELPKPPTQLTWDNAVLISPEAANKRGIATGDIVKVTTSGGSIEAAALVFDGLPEKSMQLTLGYGRKNSSPVCDDAGFNANSLRTSLSPWRAKVHSLERTGRNYALAITQTHHEMDGRALHQTTAPLDAKKTRVSASDPGSDIGLGTLGPLIPTSMESATDQWAMSIDIDACIGCSVCVVACQAENNIPVVGKKMVLMGREMHWIRIDRYQRASSGKSALAAPLPVTCMHCEKAPCEVVCPVAATSHSSTGLNQMVYNRCVGTRYCSNNCPYKVRRFNFFRFAESGDGALARQRNADVTVRARGVMEKCTYCIQRIAQARIEADKESRRIADGEIETACQQSCPTDAILFGNLADPESRIHSSRSTARAYGLLTELGTRPRTTYLKQISNSNPNLKRPT